MGMDIHFGDYISRLSVAQAIDGHIFLYHRKAYSPYALV